MKNLSLSIQHPNIFIIDSRPAQTAILRKLRQYIRRPLLVAKGTNECHNKMLRRFIPKGKSIDDYSADDILYFADKINNLPRKILGYRTPEELFEQELDRIYAAA